MREPRADGLVGPWPMRMELPNIAAYAYQDVHVWSAL